MIRLKYRFMTQYSMTMAPLRITQSIFFFVDIILKIKILLQSPVNELREQDLSATRTVHTVKLSLHILYWSHPLLNSFPHGVRCKLFLGYPLICSSVQSEECLMVFEELPQCAKKHPKLSELQVIVFLDLPALDSFLQ